jgi:hypothetical protein
MLDRSRSRRSVWLLAIASLVFLMAAMCGGSVSKEQANVTVFVDADRDGNLDRGEAPLPDTLILAEFNIHGSFRRTAGLTGEDGKVTLEAEYTHIFEIIAVPPCGAQATTPTRLDATREKRLRFGFAPQDPHPGLASFRFHLWEDRDGDGLQSSGEGPLPNFNLYADPLSGNALDSGIYFGILARQTDAQGNAVLELGNSCGSIVLPFPYGWNYTSFIPEPVSFEEGLEFPYQEGVTEVTLGLQAIPTATPAATWTPQATHTP